MMIANYPQTPCYYPASPPCPNTPPRPSYYMARSVSSDRPYLLPYYPCHMVPVYYMPVSYLCSDKNMPCVRPVSLPCSSPGDYIPSDMDLSNGWEYPQGSDWSPHQLEPGDLSPYTDWERQDEISSQDLSPRHSVSPLSVRSLSDLEGQLEGVELDPCDAIPTETLSPQPVEYDRNTVLRLKHLQSDTDNTYRQALSQIQSPCIQTLFSSTTTFSECADVIIESNNFSIPALISVLEEMIDEYSLDMEHIPWFVFRVLINVRYKKGKKFDSNLFSNAKLVYKHFVSQSHAILKARIRSECSEALEAEESSLRLSESYQDFSDFLTDL